ncbi:hypothetical protein NKH77_25620 [Streptomyces sp. M19]
MFRRILDDDALFDMGRARLVLWCRMGAWSEQNRLAVETLLTALAREMSHGVLRLFVVIDRDEDTALTGRDIVRRALDGWRRGDPRAPRATRSARSAWAVRSVRGARAVWAAWTGRATGAA